MPGPKKKLKLDTANVQPAGNNGTGIQGGLNFSSMLGNSQINGMADVNSYNYNVGQNYSYPINNNLTLQGGMNYNAFNYGGNKGSNVSGNVGANYSGAVGKNTNIDITSSLQLDKEGLSPEFRLGLQRRFSHGGPFGTPHPEDLTNYNFQGYEAEASTTDQVPQNIRNLQNEQNLFRIQQENQGEQRRVAAAKAEEKTKAQENLNKLMSSLPTNPNPESYVAEASTTSTEDPTIHKTQGQADQEHTQALYEEFKQKTGMSSAIDSPYAVSKMEQYDEERRKEEERIASGNLTRQEYFDKMAREQGPGLQSYGKAPARYLAKNPLQFLGDVFNPMMPGDGVFPDSREDIYRDTYQANYDPNQQGYTDEDGNYKPFYNTDINRNQDFVENDKRIEEERNQNLSTAQSQERSDIKLGMLIEAGTFGLGHAFNVAGKIGKTSMGKFRKDLTQDAINAGDQFTTQKILGKQIREQAEKKAGLPVGSSKFSSKSSLSGPAPTTEIVNDNGILRELKIGEAGPKINNKKSKVLNSVEKILGERYLKPKLTPSEVLKEMGHPNATKKYWAKASEVDVTHLTPRQLYEMSTQMDNREFKALLKKYEENRALNPFHVSSEQISLNFSPTHAVNRIAGETRFFDNTSQASTSAFARRNSTTREQIMTKTGPFKDITDNEAEAVMRNITEFERTLNNGGIRRTSDVVPTEHMNMYNSRMNDADSQLESLVLDPAPTAPTLSLLPPSYPPTPFIPPRPRVRQPPRSTNPAGDPNSTITGTGATNTPGATPAPAPLPAPKLDDKYRSGITADELANSPTIDRSADPNAMIGNEHVPLMRGPLAKTNRFDQARQTQAATGKAPNKVTTEASLFDRRGKKTSGTIEYERNIDNPLIEQNIKEGKITPIENGEQMYIINGDARVYLKTYVDKGIYAPRDAKGTVYHYMGAFGGQSNPLDVAAAYAEARKHLPIGGTLMENISLSNDSFRNIVSELKRQKKTLDRLVKKGDPDSLSEAAKGPSIEPAYLPDQNIRNIANKKVEVEKTRYVMNEEGISVPEKYTRTEVPDFINEPHRNSQLHMNNMAKKNTWPESQKTQFPGNKSTWASKEEAEANAKELNEYMEGLGLPEAWVKKGDGLIKVNRAEFDRLEAAAGPNNPFNKHDYQVIKDLPDEFNGQVDEYKLMIPNIGLKRLRAALGMGLGEEALRQGVLEENTSEPKQQAYGGPIAYAYGGPIKNNTMNDQNFINAMQMLQHQNMQKQQMATGGNMNPNMNPNMNQPLENGVFLGSEGNTKAGGNQNTWGSNIGAGVTGALQGVGGSLLPGQAGDMAVKGIGAVHGMIDQDVTDKDRAIMGGSRAVGAGATAVATNGATLSNGMDDMVSGTSDVITNGTEWGKENAGAINAVSGIASTAAGGAAGGAASGDGAMKGMGQAFGMPGGANAGGTPGINGNLGGFDPSQLFNMVNTGAYGGPMQMAQGGLMSIDNGGTHEQNPMGGVPVGPNASVEEGETIMDLVEGGKFVFSDRKGPKGKKGQTWSDVSKRVERKYKDREGDEAAKRAMNQELLRVAEDQEEQKAKEMAKLQAKMNNISGAPVAGMEGMPQPGMMPPQGEMAPPQMGMPDPGMMQQPQQGMPPGMPPQMGMGGMMYNMGGQMQAPQMIPGQAPMMPMQQSPMMPMGNEGMPQQPMHQMPDGTMMPGATHGEAYEYGGTVKEYETGGFMEKAKNFFNPDYKPWTAENNYGLNVDVGGKGYKFGNIDKALVRQQADMDGTLEQPFDNRVRTRNLGIAGGALANSAGDIHNLARGLQGAEEIEYDRINSDKINLHNQRLMLQNNAAGTIGNMRESMRDSGDISSMIGANAAVGQNLGQGLAKSYLDQKTTNIGIGNNDKIRNQQIDTNEQIANQQAKAAASLLVNEGLHGVGSNAAMGLYNVRQSNQVDRTNEIQTNSMNEIWKNFSMGSDGKLTWKGNA